MRPYRYPPLAPAVAVSVPDTTYGNSTTVVVEPGSSGCTTPVEQGTASTWPVPLDFHEKSRIRAAAYRAKQLYPDPIGELIARELLAVEEWGYRIARGSLNGQLVDHVLKATP